MRMIHLGVAMRAAGLLGLAGLLTASLPACSVILDTGSLSGGDVGLADLATDAGTTDKGAAEASAPDQTTVDLLVDQTWDQPTLADQTFDTALDLPPADTTFDLPVADQFYDFGDDMQDDMQPDIFTPIDDASVDGAAVDGAPVDGTAVDGAAVDGTAVDGVAVDGAAVDGAAVDGAAVDGAAVDGAAVDGAAVDGATVVDGAAVDGLAIDGAPAAAQITGTITLDPGVVCNNGVSASDCIGLLSIMEFPCSNTGMANCSSTQILTTLVDHDASVTNYSYDYSVSGLTAGATIYLDVLLEEAGGTVVHEDGAIGDLAPTDAHMVVVPAQGAPAVIQNIVLLRQID